MLVERRIDRRRHISRTPGADQIVAVQTSRRGLFVDYAVLNRANSFVRAQLPILTQVKQVNVECVGWISSHDQVRDISAPIGVGRLKPYLRFIRQLSDLV